MVGAGVTVMLKLDAGPVHPFSVAVTVRLPVMELFTVAAVKLILPDPDEPSPMAVLLLVQANDGLFPVLVKFTDTGAPEHTVTSGIVLTEGPGVTVIVKTTGSPAQIPAVGVTVIFAVWMEET